MKKLVVVIDTQYDFMMSDGRLPVAGAEEIIAPGIRFLANLNPDEVAATIFTFDTHDEATFIGSPENVGNEAAGEPGFPLHCEKGTPGWENVFNHKLIPADIPVFTLEKGVFNMWEEPNVRLQSLHMSPAQSEAIQALAGRGAGYPSIARDEFFQNLQRAGTNTVQIFGVASDFCVRWAIDGFLKAGFDVEVVEHLTRGILKQTAEMAAEDAYKAVRLV